MAVGQIVVCWLFFPVGVAQGYVDYGRRPIVGLGVVRLWSVGQDFEEEANPVAVHDGGDIGG